MLLWFFMLYVVVLVLSCNLYVMICRIFLMMVVVNGYVDIVFYLIVNGVIVNVKDS